MNWADLSPRELLTACQQADSSGSWKEFSRRYDSLLKSVALRVSRRWGRSGSHEEDDIVQEIYLKLCADEGRLLANCRDDRPEAIAGYLAVVSTHIAHDFFRHQAAQKRDTRQTASLEQFIDLPSPAQSVDRPLILDEIQRTLQGCTSGENGPRDRGIFNLYYRHGMTARLIADLPGVRLKSKGVEAVLQRLTRQVRQSLSGMQEKRRGMTS